MVYLFATAICKLSYHMFSIRMRNQIVKRYKMKTLLIEVLNHQQHHKLCCSVGWHSVQSLTKALAEFISS